MPRTRMEKLWIRSAAFAAFVLLLIGYFFFIGPQRGQTGDVNGQVADARSQNSVLQSRINTLAAQSKDLAKYQAIVTRAQLALPSTSGLPDFLRTLQSIGNSTLADVSSLTVGTPTDVTTLAAAAPAAPAASADPASPAAPATPAATPSASSATTAAAGAPGASTVGGVHVYALPITAEVSGSVHQLDDFLTQLQSVQPRAVLISQINQTSGTSAAGSGTSNSTSLTLTMQAFVAPSGAVEQAQLSAAAGK